MTAPVRRRRRPALRVASGLVLAALAGWAAWAFAVIQTPRVDAAGPVDAVLVLGGLDGDARTQRALDLVRAGDTDTMVISIPGPGVDRLARGLCASPPEGVRVICFEPDPLTTRGEARELGRLAQEHGWTRVAVTTSVYHLSRSRMIVGRCFDGTLLMLPSGEHTSAAKWAYEWVYQTAGFVKAQLLRGC